MDKLAKRLREDAAKIDAEVSAQLDGRIRASLAGIEPETVRQTRPRSRHAAFWLASSLTGVAAALAVIVVLNVIESNEPASVPRTVVDNTLPPITVPGLALDAEAVALTSPLVRELEDLRADLRKAEEVVRGDVRIDL